jgi:hypothetical protein
LVTTIGVIASFAILAHHSVPSTDLQGMGDTPKAGRETKLQFTISRSGQPFTALPPYLGAYGHLVALRKSDLAYSHVHPIARDLAKGSISFTAEFPTSGVYRLFLQFRTSTGVHTAPFTVDVVDDHARYPL